jgi:hypothetical protein
LGSRLTNQSGRQRLSKLFKSCTVERCFLTSNDLKMHEVGRRAKNSRYILSKLGCYEGGNLLPFRNPLQADGTKGVRKAFYISGTAFFLLEYSGILPTVLHKKGVTDGPTGKAFWLCAQVRI